MPADTPPAAAADPKHFAFAFELTGVKNENMLCPVDHHVCRGAWNAKHLTGQTPDPKFSELPNLPGLVFIINTKKREVRRFDPLILPQNATLLKLAQKALALITNQPPPTAERGRLWVDCDPDFVKTMVYWWWKLAGCKRAKVVKGAPPVSLDDIRQLPGNVTGEIFNQSATAVRTVPNDSLKWRPPTDDDFVREPETPDELPDPFIDIPADPREYLDRPPPASGYTKVTGGRSAADVLMGDSIGGAGPTYADPV